MDEDIGPESGIGLAQQLTRMAWWSFDVVWRMSNRVVRINKIAWEIEYGTEYEVD